MRKRFNRAAVCSSANYRASRKAHLDMLDERHAHFKVMTLSGELSIDVPVIKGCKVTPKFKTIRVFGKDMRVSIEEYNTHCVSLGL